MLCETGEGVNSESIARGKVKCEKTEVRGEKVRRSEWQIADS